MPIKTLKPAHERIIDLLLANPNSTGADLARATGYTEAWISQIRNSDAFRHQYASRRAELVNPEVTAMVHEQFTAVAQRAIDKVAAALGGDKGDRVALDVIKATGQAARFGARTSAPAVAVPAEGRAVVTPINPLSNW